FRAHWGEGAWHCQTCRNESGKSHTLLPQDRATTPCAGAPVYAAVRRRKGKSVFRAVEVSVGSMTPDPSFRQRQRWRLNVGIVCGTRQKISPARRLRQQSRDTTDILSGFAACPHLTPLETSRGSPHWWFLSAVPGRGVGRANGRMR